MSEPTCETCRFSDREVVANEMMSGETFWSHGFPVCRHPASHMHGKYVAIDDHCGEHQPRSTTPPTPDQQPHQHDASG